MADLSTDVRYIKGVGESRAKALEKLGVRTLRDLIAYFPRRYEDRSVIHPIAELPVDETACCRAMIAAEPVSRRITGGRTVVKVRAVDESGVLDVTFFNQPYRQQSLHTGESYIFCGKVEGNLLRRQMTNPLLEPEGQHQLTGRIVPPKGQLEAIDALALLHKKQPGQFHLYFAGQVPGYDGGEYRHLLEKRITQAGLGDCVHFLGEVADIRQIRSQMDLELVCAWCETFGRVTIEAMCARLPVIGTNTGGTPEIIVNEKTGLLYPPHDTQLLSEQILWCAVHPEQTRQMAEAGYQRVRECFSIQATVDKVYAVISQAVSSEREKP